MCRVCNYSCCEFTGTSGCGCENCLERLCWDIDDYPDVVDSELDLDEQENIEKELNELAKNGILTNKRTLPTR